MVLKSRDGGLKSKEASMWRPGLDNVEERGELQCDPSAYDSLHGLHVGCPCFSFDVLRDSLGLQRTEFPHTLYCVAGTEAEKSSRDYIALFKVSNISGKKLELVPEKRNDANTDMEIESGEEDDGSESGAPILQLRKVSHDGFVNCIRAMPQNPHICASWSHNGIVEVLDLSSHLNSLVESTSEATHDGSTLYDQAPLKRFNGHKDEGYALDWSPLVAGRLLSGDLKHCIYLWEPSDSTWNVDGNPYVGHRGCIEDLQWSPTEHFLFASGSADGRIAIWDTRLGRLPVITVTTQKAGVNAIAWNSLRSCMLASGSDDGTFSIRDLRLLKNNRSAVADFDYHTDPIQWIEWSPHKASNLAVSSSDNRLTIWDWSRGRKEKDGLQTQTEEQVKDSPGELLFVHKGQKDLTEFHWHSQIPGMLISTGSDGFNIFRPSNI